MHECLLDYHVLVTKTGPVRQAGYQNNILPTVGWVSHEYPAYTSLDVRPTTKSNCCFMIVHLIPTSRRHRNTCTFMSLTVCGSLWDPHVQPGGIKLPRPWHSLWNYMLYEFQLDCWCTEHTQTVSHPALMHLTTVDPSSISKGGHFWKSKTPHPFLGFGNPSCSKLGW